MNDQVTPSRAGGTEGYAGSAHPQPYLHEIVSAVLAPTMCLSGRDGQIRKGGAEGLYVRDIRAISSLIVTVCGREPVALGSYLHGGPRNEFHSVVEAPAHRMPDPKAALWRERVLKPLGMAEHLRLRSYAPPLLTCRVEVRFESDLADISLVKAGGKGKPKRPKPTPGGLSWELPAGGALTALGQPHPDVVDVELGCLGWDISVEAGQEAYITVDLSFEEADEAPIITAADPGQHRLGDLQVEALDHRLVKFLTVSLADADCLLASEPSRPGDAFLAAGAPWYLTLFGRDSIWSARMLLPLGTDIALGTLRTLARHQGARSDMVTGEEPGKILHEVRRDRPQQTLRLPPVYYGTVDATPLWVCLLHDAWKWGAPKDEVAGLIGPMRRCLEWVEQCGSAQDGFIRYVDTSGRGLANQGWKDSFDGIRFRDGRLAGAPIALCEVQGYAYEAALAGADLLDWAGTGGAERWREFAASLAERFRERFWVEGRDGPYPAVAIDKEGRPVDSLSSNIGHLLGTGILDATESELVARQLMAPDLNSGFGLRTLAASSVGFNPVSYHIGSVWAHDTAIAICGLAKFASPLGQQAAASLAEGLLAAAEYFSYRLPELYGGHQRKGLAGPLPYPAACHPQAWAAASSVAVLAALLGIQPHLPRERVEIRPLSSPIGLRRVSGLQLGGCAVTAVLESTGHAKLIGAPPGVRVVAGYADAPPAKPSGG